MSAYICDRNHIVYLVSAALSRTFRQGGGDFYWYHNGESHRLSGGDYAYAAEVANMLWRENIKSVSHRYPGESSATLPGPVGEDFVIEADAFPAFSHFDPLQVLQSIACFSYQTCEHDEWEDSEAFAFCEALKSAAIHALPGYDKTVWGAPEPNCYRGAAA